MAIVSPQVGAQLIAAMQGSIRIGLASSAAREEMIGGADSSDMKMSAPHGVFEMPRSLEYGVDWIDHVEHIGWRALIADAQENPLFSIQLNQEGATPVLVRGSIIDNFATGVNQLADSHELQDSEFELRWLFDAGARMGFVWLWSEDSQFVASIWPGEDPLDQFALRRPGEIVAAINDLRRHRLGYRWEDGEPY